MVAPLAWLGLLAAKKAVAVSVYMIGKRYGWPRVYRRILEANTRYTPPGQRDAVRRLVKRGFYLPEQAEAIVKDSAVFQLLSRMVLDRHGQLARPSVWHAATTLVRAGPAAVAEVAAHAARLLRRGAPAGGGGGGDAPPHEKPGPGRGELR
jgi:hypothetical protein